MTSVRLGLVTLQTYVESWECDFNGHWSARFYGRAFQSAAEVVADIAGLGNPGMATCLARHIRYHREIHSSDAVVVHSARVLGGAYAGCIAHFLMSNGHLVSTALDQPGMGSSVLPEADPALLGHVLPRNGIEEMAQPWNNGMAHACITETGPVLVGHVDMSGHLLIDEMIRRSGVAIHLTLGNLGYHSEFINNTGISRMAAESCIVRMGRCPPGASILVKSCLTAVRNRSFVMKHWLETRQGAPVGVIRDNLISVNLQTRRAVEVPEFLRPFRHWPERSSHPSCP